MSDDAAQQQNNDHLWDDTKPWYHNVANIVHQITSVTDPDTMYANTYELYRKAGMEGPEATQAADRNVRRTQAAMDRTENIAGMVSNPIGAMQAYNFIAPHVGPNQANAGEDEVARQMQYGLRSSPQGYAETPVNQQTADGYEKGGLVDKALQRVRHYDDGGTIPQQNPVDVAKQVVQTPRPRFQIRQSGTAPAQAAPEGGYQFMQLPEGKANTNSLREAFKRGIERHLSLPEDQRIANSRAALRTLEPYMGRNKDGSQPALLSQNAKLLKAQAGTKDKAPIQLDDGRGVETIGLSLYPDYREGEMKLCPNSASCRDECLGKTSGQYSEAFSGSQEKKGGISVRQRALNRTKAMMREPEAFAVRLWDDIESARRMAERNGNHLGVRLNTLSDLNPVIHEPIIKNQPDVSFYDYSKMGWNPVADNHHYTHSSTGLTQDGINNPHTNWRKMRRFLDRGDNVAMVFSGSKELPSFVHDQETGKRYKVVDGKSHDFRPLDIQPEGEDGAIVGLTNLKSTGKRNTAHIDSKGFFVHYDPKKHGDTVPIIPQNKTKED